MNKTIYIRDEDVSVWERARELAGDKLAPIIMTGLKRFIAEREAQEAAAKGFERIELEFNDADDHFIPKIKAFNGRWIIPKTKPHKVTNEDGDRQWSYSLALTLKGSTVVYWIDEDREGRAEHFRVFSSLRAAAEDREVNSVARRDKGNGDTGGGARHMKWLEIISIAEAVVIRLGGLILIAIFIGKAILHELGR